MAADNQNISLTGWSGGNYGTVYDTGAGNAQLRVFSVTAREMLARDSRYTTVRPAGALGPVVILESGMLT
ncbi:hypothetical protein ACWAUC_19740 [Bradyrhizobium guangdongense]